MKINLPEGFDIPWIMRADHAREPFQRLDVRPGDTVLDIGAYAGTFAASAIEAGARYVVAYEAHPKNAELARTNLRRYGKRQLVVHAAIIPGDVTDATVILRVSGFGGSHSIARPDKENWKPITVPAVGIRTVLWRVEPTVIKVDIESAEYDMLGSLRSGDLSTVRSMFVEFHLARKNAARIEVARAFLRSEGLVESPGASPRESTWSRGAKG